MDALFSGLVPLIPALALAATLVIAMWLVGGILRSIAQEKRILRDGEPAEATVLRQWDTGTRINGRPVFEMLLEVRRPGQGAYQVKAKKRAHLLNAWRMGPGMTVAVKVDRADPGRVAIVEPELTPPIYGQTLAQVVVNGQTLSRTEGLPPEARQAVSRAMSLLADADGNGVPDAFEGRPAARASEPSSAPTTSTSDPVKALTDLKAMLDAGLVTPAEYEAKKAEILARM